MRQLTSMIAERAERTRSQTLAGIFVFISFLTPTITSCGGPAKGYATLNVQVSGALISKPRTQTLGRSRGNRLPSAASGFDCLVVNVMGDGIARRNEGEHQASFPAILAGSYCAYPGILSGFIATPQASQSTASAKIAVPIGKNRVVQVLGIVSPTGCAGKIEDELVDDADDSSKIAGIYELGRAIVDTGSDITVNIANAYDSATPHDVTCGEKRKLVDCSKHTSDAPFAGGDGTITDPYAICTAAQLANIAAVPALSANFVLGDDIDLAPAGNWAPIGSVATPFSGTFDGGNFQITNLTYTGSASYTGLFGYSTGTLQDVNVSGSITMSSGSPVNIGLLVGESTGTIKNAHVSGSVDGGINGSNVGGLVGYMTSGSISASSSSATVSGSYGIGGFAGFIDGTTAPTSVVESSSSTGSVSASSTIVGGFASGISNSALVHDCYVILPSALGGTGSVGGFVGELTNNGSIQNSYVSGAAAYVPAVTNSGAFAGWKVGAGSYSNLYALTGLSAGTNGNGSDAAALTAGQMVDAVNFTSLFNGFDFALIWRAPDGSNPPRLR